MLSESAGKRKMKTRRQQLARYRELHKTRHLELHKAFDELLADYLAQNRDARPSTTSVLDLMQWSHQQSIKPTETPTSGKPPGNAEA